MSRNQDLKNARNEAIKKAHSLLETETKENGKKYKYEELLAKLSSKFFLDINTIHNILVKN